MAGLFFILILISGVIILNLWRTFFPAIYIGQNAWFVDYLISCVIGGIILGLLLLLVIEVFKIVLVTIILSTILGLIVWGLEKYLGDKMYWGIKDKLVQIGIIVSSLSIAIGISIYNFNKLSDEELVSQPDVINQDLDIQASIAEWNDKISLIINKSIDDIEMADQDLITNLLDEYHRLPYDVKVEEQDSYSLLLDMERRVDELLVENQEKEYQELANEWLEECSVLTDKVDSEVTLEDRITLDSLLNKYEELPFDVKNLVSDSKASLDIIQNIIDELEWNHTVAENEATNWRENHRSIIEKSFEDLNEEDLLAIEQALIYAEMLNPATLKEITEECKNLADKYEYLIQ